MSQQLVPLDLEQDALAIKQATFHDFTKNMGCHAVEITYNNDDKQIFTTKSTNPNCHGTYEFETKDELVAFYNDPKPK